MNRVSYLAAALVSSVVVFACAPAAAPAPTSAPPAQAPQPAAAPKPEAAPKPSAAPEAKAAPKPSVSFAGKTVTLLVPFSPGGSLHINAVMWQPFIQKHFPGNPPAVVNNMPGAGGLIGENWCANQAPRDGTVICMLPTAISHHILIPEQIKYDLKTFRWLVSYNDTDVLYGSAKLGVKSSDDLLKIPDLAYGEQAWGSSRTQEGYFFLKLLGANFKTVLGFASSGDSRAALQRNELHVTQDSLSGYMAAVKSLVAEGVAVPIAQSGTRQEGKIVRLPVFSDIPTFAEALVKARGEAIRAKPEFKAMEVLQLITDTYSVTYPPGTPDEIYQAAAASIKAMFADPEFQQKYQDTLGFKPISHDAAQTQVAIDAALKSFQQDPEALNLMQKIGRDGP